MWTKSVPHTSCSLAPPASDPVRVAQPAMAWMLLGLQCTLGAVLCAGYTAVEVAILHLVRAHVLYGDAQCDPDDHERRVHRRLSGG